MGWKGDRTTLVIYCQPANWVSKCWRHLATDPKPLPRISPMLWNVVRTEMRTSVPAASWQLGKFPTTGIIALWVALRFCGRVRLYGFGNESHAWNCPVSPGSAPTCSKYFRANVDGLVSHHSVRQSCGKWWKFAPYVAESGRFHDLPMEWGWIQELLRQGRIEAPGCDVRDVRHGRHRHSLD